MRGPAAAPAHEKINGEERPGGGLEDGPAAHGDGHAGQPEKEPEIAVSAEVMEGAARVLAEGVDPVLVLPEGVGGLLQEKGENEEAGERESEAQGEAGMQHGRAKAQWPGDRP